MFLVELGDFPRFIGLFRRQQKPRLGIVIGDLAGDFGRVDLGKRLRSFLNPVLQKQVNHQRKIFVIAQKPLITQQLEERTILFRQPVVYDDSLGTKGVGPCVDQRFVFEMFVLVPLHRVNNKQRALNGPGTIIDNGIVVFEELPGGSLIVMEKAIRPEGVVVDMPCCKEFGNLAKEGTVIHSEGDLV